MMNKPQPLPYDGVRIPNFATATPQALEQIKARLQLSLHPKQLRYIQYHYVTKEKKDPTLGELILLDHLVGQTPPASYTAPGELYCNSPELMETWADIMQANQHLCGVTAPCSLQNTLELPRELLMRMGHLSAQNKLPKMTPAGDVRHIKKGMLPTHTWEAEGQTNWVFLPQKETPLKALGNTPKANDVLLVILRGEIEQVLSILSQHPMMQHISDFRMVTDTSLTQAALELCPQACLNVQLHNFLRQPDTPTESYIKKYLNVCETPCAEGTCHVVLRTSPAIELPLLQALTALGMNVYRYGYLTKGHRLIVWEKSTVAVRLDKDFVLSPAYPLLSCYALPDPQPISFEGQLSPPACLPHLQMCMTQTTESIPVFPDTDGYALGVGHILAASEAMAKAGIAYTTLQFGVSIHFDGEPQHPSLLSLVCGLYRSATELGRPIEDPQIILSPTSTDTPTLQLCVSAYAPMVTNTSPLLDDMADTTDMVGHGDMALYPPYDFHHIRHHLEEISREAFDNSSMEEKILSPLSLPSLDIIKQTAQIKQKERMAIAQMKNFISLSQKPRPVILDTDIGPDCDDVGALAVLIHYAKQYNFPIMGICNCTSMKAGNGIIDAVCRRCGIDTPPIGQWSKPDFMNNPEYHKYNDDVATAFSEGYRNGTLQVQDEVTFYRTLLSSAKDGEVMVISIGMFNNLAALLQSGPDHISPLTGEELVKAKVYALVSMAAILPEGRECNVICDYPSAQLVFDKWPTPMYFSDFNIGVSVQTGYGHITDPDAIHADPLAMAYHYYTKDWPVHGNNASYDLTAVQFAAVGVGDLYGLDTPGKLEFYAALPETPDVCDATRFIPDPMGNRIFMTKKASDAAIAQSLNDILHNI